MFPLNFFYNREKIIKITFLGSGNFFTGCPEIKLDDREVRPGSDLFFFQLPVPESLDRGRAQVVEQQVGVRTWGRGFDPAVRLLARDQQNEPEAVKKESSI